MSYTHAYVLIVHVGLLYARALPPSRPMHVCVCDDVSARGSAPPVVMATIARQSIVVMATIICLHCLAACRLSVQLTVV